MDPNRLVDMETNLGLKHHSHRPRDQSVTIWQRQVLEKVGSQLLLEDASSHYEINWLSPIHSCRVVNGEMVET